MTIILKWANFAEEIISPVPGLKWRNDRAFETLARYGPPQIIIFREPDKGDTRLEQTDTDPSPADCR